MSNPPTPRDGQSPRQRTPQLSSRSARGYQAGRFSSWGSQLTPRPPMCADPVHVCIRMKPPPEGARPDSLIRFSIEQGTPTTPATTPRTPRTTFLSLTVRGGGGSSGGANGGSSFSGSGGNGTVTASSGSVSGDSTSVEEQRTYEFTDIIPPSAGDAAVERVVVPRVMEQVRQGYNAAVMCYGQTGSGKTHTINALLPRLVEAVFATTEGEECKDFTFIVRLSYIQIYNSNVYNLLTESRAELGEALPRPKGTIVAEPMVVVRSAAEVLATVGAAQKRRAVAPHAMNAKSSRSHTLLTLAILKQVDGTTVQSSRLTVADLAGSERLKKTGVAGESMDEAIAINKSLSALARVIEAAGTAGSAVPIRDSVLTLYLAQSLQDSYMFLIANVSSEVCNLPETKSTLEFALIARKCVVQRMKTSVGGSRDTTFEDMQRILNREIAMLRLRVEDLQRETDLERRRNAVLQRKLEQRTASSNELQLQEAHIRQLEGDTVKISVLLREREDELRFLEKRRDAMETVTADISLRESEKEEARATLACGLAGGIAGDEVEELRARLERANDAFLWQEEQLRAEEEKNHIVEETVRALQAECRKMRSELYAARQAALAWEKDATDMKGAAESHAHQVAEWQRLYDALEVQLFKERNDFKARQITVETFCSARNVNDEVRSLDKALTEQTKLLDSVQARLTSCEQELFETDRQRSEWEQKAIAADRLYENLWASISPAEKVRFVRSDRLPAGPISFDAVTLRNNLNRANQRCEELTSMLRMKDSQVEELEMVVQQLAEARDERDKEFETLRALEEAHSMRGEQLEAQLEALYSEIDAHCSRREQLEQRLKDTHAEWERLDHEFRESQKEIDALTNKLDEALQKLRQFEQSNDELTARLREAEEQKDSMKMRRDAEHARVIELERQLREQEQRSLEVKHQRDNVAEQHSHIARELRNSDVRSDMFASRIPPGAGAGLKKKLLSVRRTPSESFMIHPEPVSFGKQLADQTKRRQLRFEVSQVRRASAAAAAATTEHRDPTGGGGLSRRAAGGPHFAIDITKRFAFQQRSPRGLNTRVSAVQQVAQHKQSVLDQQAVNEAKQPPIPPLSLIQMRNKSEMGQPPPPPVQQQQQQQQAASPTSHRPPQIPPLSLGKRNTSGRRR